MTSPAPMHTDGECADVRVRSTESRRVVPIRPGMGDPSARTRAITRSPQPINNNPPGKIRNFASQHVGEARQSLADSWLGQDRPQNLTAVAKTVFARGNRRIGWFRLTVYTLAYLACFAVDTNKRAAVTAGLLTLSLLAAWATAALTG